MNYIKDPITHKDISIFSKKGQEIIDTYSKLYNQYQPINITK